LPPFSNPEKNQGFQGWRLDGQIYRLQVAARRAFQVGQAFDKVWRRNAQKQLPWIGLRENLQGKSPLLVGNSQRPIPNAAARSAAAKMQKQRATLFTAGWQDM